MTSTDRIRIERSGGFAGITRTAEITDPDAMRRLTAALPPAAGDDRIRDGFQYRFEVTAGEAAAPAVFECAESQLPEAVRSLVADAFRR